MNSLQKSFETKAVRYSNMWMYFTEFAVEFVSECKRQHIPVNGLDAFLLSGRGIQPDMEHSLWFGDDGRQWDEAIRFLQLPENQPYLYEIFFEGYNN